MNFPVNVNAPGIRVSGCPGADGNQTLSRKAGPVRHPIAFLARLVPGHAVRVAVRRHESDLETAVAHIDHLHAEIGSLRGSPARRDGLPQDHPESMLSELGPADEIMLAAYANDMWPADEYESFTADDGGAS